MSGYRHNPRCAIFHEPPSLRDPSDCNCGAIPPLPQAPSPAPSGVTGEREAAKRIAKAIPDSWVIYVDGSILSIDRPAAAQRFLAALAEGPDVSLPSAGSGLGPSNNAVKAAAIAAGVIPPGIAEHEQSSWAEKWTMCREMLTVAYLVDFPEAPVAGSGLVALDDVVEALRERELRTPDKDGNLGTRTSAEADFIEREFGSPEGGDTDHAA